MPEVETLVLVHHSHTDVGFTHDQPVVWDLYRRFPDSALDLCLADADRQGDDAFCWTLETTWPLLRWLQSAPASRRRQLGDLCRLGRMEITAMPLNMTPLCDTGQLLEALEAVRDIRQELGVPVRHAMNSDVNGQNWPLVDALLGIGVRAFSMAINIHFGGHPPGRPAAFRWVGPSGRELPTWNGWTYGEARRLGLGVSVEAFGKSWARLRQSPALRGRAPDLPLMMVQIIGRFGDNGSTDPGLPAFVRRWNATGQRPHLILGTPAAFWSRMDQYRERLPRRRGDWTDFWNFGAGSSARETAINRANRARLRAADAAGAALSALGGGGDPRQRPPAGPRAEAVASLNLWDEHTWGADASVRAPENEDTVSQWYHKAIHAYRARSLSLLLQRDAVAELARRVERPAGEGILVFNPAPHARVLCGPVPDVRLARQRGGAEDPTAARHFQDRATRGAWAWLPPTQLPGYGYAVVPLQSLLPPCEEVGHEETVECGRHRLTFDTSTGGIRSWWDQELGTELVHASCPWPLHGFVHERPVGEGPWPRALLWSGEATFLVPQGERGWHPGWPAERRGPTRVREHRVERTPIGVRVWQRLEAPGVDDLVQAVTLTRGQGRVEFRSDWRMSQETGPEATYLVFPFALPGATARLDVGTQAMQPEREQIPGCCRDYFTTQRWVDLAGADGGITVATPDTPLVQLGGFRFAENASVFRLSQPWLLAWVTNNYWETNFRASQPGGISVRLVLEPYRGPFEEARAHRLGMEEELRPVLQHLGEPVAPGPTLPPGGSLLHLPSGPVQVLGLRADAPDGSVLLRLVNASDGVAEARVGPGVLRIRRAARCDLLGQAQATLSLPGGEAALMLAPRELSAMRLWLSA